jgi:hypothetical protein
VRIDKFHFTTHCSLRAVQRGLSHDEIRDVINYHERRAQEFRGEHGGFVWKFEKTVKGVKLVVIAEVKKAECWPISSWKE